PAYLARAHILDDGYRLGRSKPLTPFQKQFKAAWRALQTSPISDDADKKYITRVDRWTCTCKGYKFHACHLCKHLVQAVPSPPMRFWNQVVRRRTVPLYRHPDLIAINAEMDGQYIEPLDGSITDGDDHAWSGNPAILGGNGGWQEFDFSTTSLLGKRGRSRGSSEASDNTLEEEEVRRQFFPAFGGDESDDEEERQKNKEHILKRAKDLRRAAEILEAQAEAGNAIWMASIVRRNIGNDSTARRRDNTWGKQGDKEANRRMANTMGYQVPQ
ncbi:hypothetical protein B0H11DRAFT_2342886, partial [Mycena galericulata]